MKESRQKKFNMRVVIFFFFFFGIIAHLLYNTWLWLSVDFSNLVQALRVFSEVILLMYLDFNQQRLTND